jgi:carboxylate-amine ligase
VALSANSPYHDGDDTSYASFRRIQWGQWPTAGPTAAFGDVPTYRRTVDGLIASGAARDAGMIYFDARLSANYPTVEVRVCDVSIDATTAVALAALIRGIVESVVRTGADDVPRPELLQAAHWRAARYGLSDDLVDLGVDLRADAAAQPRALLVPAAKVIDDLLAFVQPALDDAGDTDTVRGELDRLRTEGTGAQRQRAVVAATGDVAAAVDAATVRP